MPTSFGLPFLHVASRALAAAALMAMALAAPAVAQVSGRASFDRWTAGGADPRAGGVGGDITASPDARAPQARGVGTVGLGGLAGAAIGVLVLGTAGYYIDRATECNDDFCGLDGILIGGSIGSTTLTPLGAHLANERQGRLVPSLLASAAGTGALWLLAEATGDEEIVLAVPLVNLITSVLIERATTRAH
jgi:hypothetical protein